MQSTQYEFQRRQIVLIARVTPYAMVGHVANTAVIAIALAGSVQAVPLIIWCAYSCSTALLLLHFAMGKSADVRRAVSNEPPRR